ncbi:MAG: hypothetical protein WAK55_23260 [Xanthobacteraceae bacterium]
MTIPSELDKFRTKADAQYVVRDGKRIEVETLGPKKGRKRHKPFKATWSRLPKHWSDQLEQARGMTTYQLAHRVLHETFRRQVIGGSVILSGEVTGLPHTSRRRATKDMLRLGLFSIVQEGKRAAVVTELLLGNGETLRLEPRELPKVD